MLTIASKIDNLTSIEHFEEIAKVSDGILLARGHLADEIPVEKVFHFQKAIIVRCNMLGLPVIVATQMLESMCTSPRPTRAEASDVANSVIDGADALMLTDETAIGDYPIEAIQMMNSICFKAEGIIDYNRQSDKIRTTVLESSRSHHMDDSESVASSAVKTAHDVQANLIACLSLSGNSAIKIAKYRPEKPILVLTPSETIARQLEGLIKNCICTVISEEIAMNQLNVANLAINIGREKQLLIHNDKDIMKKNRIVFIYGIHGFIRDSTSVLQIIDVTD